MNLLFPGRHIVNTRFQEDYLIEILNRPIGELTFIHPPPHDLENQTLDEIIFAITSSNQAYSRYNPVPYDKRILGVDRFGKHIKETFGTHYRIFGIPDFGLTDRFARITLQEIEDQTEGELSLTPLNTVVLSSTPGVIAMYANLGFGVLPAELQTIEPEKYRAKIPIEIVREIAGAGDQWRNNCDIRALLAPTTLRLLNDFPEISRQIIRLYTDPILTEEGSLTETRNYDSYQVGMNNRDIMQIKYNDIKWGIKEGRIVDEGCATGDLLMYIAQHHPDSDFIGIELSGEFIARAQENIRAHRFGNGTHIRFEQRNLMFPIFKDSSIDTTICNSTGHELWSYGQQEKTVMDYLALKLKQTRKGGRLVMRDVVGPENKDELVYMLCNALDGLNENVFAQFDEPAQLSAHLSNLSTYSRFMRFSEDFLADMRASGRRGHDTKIRYHAEDIDGKTYIVLRMKDAAEFMATKDYADNWQSEMNEEFTFWSFNEWKQALQKTGFHVMDGSCAYTSTWIAENRFEGKVALYKKGKEGHLTLLDHPATNLVLVGEKR